MPAKLVLIVEDNERSLKLERDVLQMEGYRTLEARTAEDGIVLAVAQLPDLILMDIRLPGIDGVTALARLRADSRTASIPVIALTSSAMTDDLERFRQAGFDGYLAKPIDLREFRHEVAARCGVTLAEG
jgi:two-component system, cell cycle response regulator DivK